VSVFLLWAQWLWHGVLAGREVLVLNLDETAISRGMAPRRGHVVPHRAPRARQRFARIALREQRGHMSYVSVIVDNPAAQRLMPQTFLVNGKRVTRADRAALRALESPLIAAMDEKGWVSADNFAPVLTSLRRACRAANPRAVILLVMDCATQHTARKVLAHLARLAVLVLLVPAGLTWLLQPLDSHVFNGFKREVYRLQVNARAASPTGALLPGAWIEVAAQAARSHIIDRDWSGVMESNGLRGPVPSLRQRILDLLPDALPLPLRPPSEAELRALLGRPGAGMRARLLAVADRTARAAPAVPPPRRPPSPDRIPRGVPLGFPLALGRFALARPGGAPAPGARPAARPPAGLRRTRSGAVYGRD